jgi:hypothetical protein
VHGFLPGGNWGLNLQRTIGLKALLPRALCEPDARIVLNTGSETSDERKKEA